MAFDFTFPRHQPSIPHRTQFTLRLLSGLTSRLESKGQMIWVALMGLPAQPDLTYLARSPVLSSIYTSTGKEDGFSTLTHTYKLALESHPLSPLFFLIFSSYTHLNTRWSIWATTLGFTSFQVLEDLPGNKTTPSTTRTRAPKDTEPNRGEPSTSIVKSKG